MIIDKEVLDLVIKRGYRYVTVKPDGKINGYATSKAPLMKWQNDKEKVMTDLHYQKFVGLV